MKISERMLEDWICENPEAIRAGLKIIDRQVQLPHGRLDVLAYDGEFVMPIELKARPLKERDIGQLLRYVHDITDAVQSIAMSRYYDVPINHPEEATIKHDIFSKVWFRYHGYAGHTDPVFIPCLIGTAISPKISAACSAIYAEVLLWGIEDGEIQLFPPKWSGISGYSTKAPFPSWLYKLHNRIRETIDETTDIEYELYLESLFNPTND